MRSEIINAVQDTPRHVTNSLTTLVRHELVVKVKRNQYAVYLNIIITSELDGAVLGLQDSNLYGYLYEKVMLSVDTTVYNTEVRVRVKNTEVMIGNKQGYITPLVVKTPVHSTLFKDTVPCTPVSIQYIQTVITDTDILVTDITDTDISLVNNTCVDTVRLLSLDNSVPVTSTIVGEEGCGDNNHLSETTEKGPLSFPDPHWTGLMDLPAFFANICGVPALDPTVTKFTALCLFHSERTPSFTVNVVTGLWGCFGCGVHGRGMFELLDALGYDGQELLDFAYDYSLDVAPDDERRAKVLAREQQLDRVTDSKRQYDNEIGMVRDWYANGYGGANVVTDWTHGLATPERDYLFTRGIMPDALQHFKAAVFLNLPDHRLYFPLALNGVVYGYQRRDIRDSKHTPKYLTMTGMEKSHHVYGELMAPSDFRGEQQVALVVEGVTDMLVAFQRGLLAVCATLGAIVSDEQVQELAGLGITRVIHATHPDAAGDTAFALGRVAFAGVGIESVRLGLDTDIADSRRDDFLDAYADALTSFTSF